MLEKGEGAQDGICDQKAVSRPHSIFARPGVPPEESDPAAQQSFCSFLRFPAVSMLATSPFGLSPHKAVFEILSFSMCFVGFCLKTIFFHVFLVSG